MKKIGIGIIGLGNIGSYLYKYLQENKDRAKKMNLRQFRYIKFIDKRQKKNCLLKQMPYPKHYKEGVEKNG